MANDIRPESRWDEPRSTGAARAIAPAFWTHSGDEVVASEVGPATAMTVEYEGGNRLLRPIGADYVLIQDPLGDPGDVLVSSSGTPIAHMVADPETPGGYKTSPIGTGSEAADIFDHDGTAVLASITPFGRLRKVGSRFTSEV